MAITRTRTHEKMLAKDIRLMIPHFSRLVKQEYTFSFFSLATGSDFFEVVVVPI